MLSLQCDKGREKESMDRLIPELFCLRNRCIVCHQKLKHKGMSLPLCALGPLESTLAPSSRHPKPGIVINGHGK